mmetsp:Transcript_6195/g.19091  ORF Transcript_6195/g.19091 Transcript_6195/m.19091 type:complete len:250 (+) Transcript_6195:129-878(+)
MAPASSLVAAFVVLAPLFADGRALRQERGDPRTLLVIGAHMFGKDENDADYQKWKSQTWDRTILVEANPFVYRDLAAAATTFPASFGKVEVYNWGVMSRAAHGFIREENKCPSFYHVNRTYLANHPELPHQYDQIGSFRISHVLKHIPKRLHDGDPYFVAQSKIECRLLPEILEELRPATLKLDTEGLDCDLIKAVPCRTWQLAHVSSIVFEWKHCPTVAARAIWQVVRCKFEIASFGEEDVHMTRVEG